MPTETSSSSSAPASEPTSPPNQNGSDTRRQEKSCRTCIYIKSILKSIQTSSLFTTSHSTTRTLPTETSTNSTTTQNTSGQQNRSDFHHQEGTATTPSIAGPYSREYLSNNTYKESMRREAQRPQFGPEPPLITNNTRQQEESCQSCLYTGVGTCVGLSGYFLYLALEEDRPQKQHKNNTHGTASSSQQYNNRLVPTSFQSSLMKFMQGNPAPKKNRPFLFAFSAVWAVAGAYRLYLN